jgi:hypothetical protein
MHLFRSPFEHPSQSAGFAAAAGSANQMGCDAVVLVKLLRSHRTRVAAELEAARGYVGSMSRMRVASNMSDIGLIALGHTCSQYLPVCQ